MIVDAHADCFSPADILRGPIGEMDHIGADAAPEHKDPLHGRGSACPGSAV